MCCGSGTGIGIGIGGLTYTGRMQVEIAQLVSDQNTESMLKTDLRAEVVERATLCMGTVGTEAQRHLAMLPLHCD